ncbi:bZIP transcription factor 27 isoform X2 [Vigna radiata var. radiata]|uniref:BZIP transcription factor 27 isoform X2 n=1 Tax=Vigna radiata var. radiata TaxID=3916 RepID=A0A3Q0F2C5_VIGRR|nr:bZIP transcription factor 27 isoform X2 [Vigna radiata var. radiata]
MASPPSKPPHILFSVREKAMASSSPCDYWPHLSHSLSSPSSSSPSPSPSSLSQTLLPPPPPPSVEHVWNDLKLSSLSNSPVDFNHSSSHSSLLSLSPSHNHHSLLSLSNASFHSNHTARHRDQHHNRIMKNRESAVRSRARKQAHRKGLEDEIARLTEENSRLRKELKEFSLSSSENSPQRTSAPCRTTSSPF